MKDVLPYIKEKSFKNIDVKLDIKSVIKNDMLNCYVIDVWAFSLFDTCNMPIYSVRYLYNFIGLNYKNKIKKDRILVKIKNTVIN